MVFLAASGCMSRKSYFTELDQRRIRAYEQWKADTETLDRPRLHGALALEEAIRLALAYNPSLKAVLQEKERARGRMIGAYSEALPSVSLTGNYTRLDQVTTVDLGVDSFQIGDVDNYSFQVTVEQPLYKGGTIQIAQRAARLFKYLTDEQVRRAVERVISEVATTYCETILTSHLVEVRQAALDSAQAHLDEVESRRKHGVATEYDVLRAEVDVSNFDAELITQRNAHDLALARLFKLLGVSQRSDVKLTDKLVFEEVDMEYAAAVLVAFRNRPDLFIAMLEADLQQEALNRARTEYLPRLNAYYWRKWAKPDPHEASNIAWNDQWQAGLALSWTLFDGLEREGAIIEQAAVVERSLIELSNTEEQALLELRNALSELENSHQLVVSQKLNLARADRALELVKVGYREGANTEIEVLDATTALTRARGTYYRALFQHTSARIALQLAMGILGPPPGAREMPKEVDLGARLDEVSGRETGD